MSSLIEISLKNETVHLEVKDGLLSLATLRRYFPKASGLTFLKNKLKCVVSFSGEKIILPRGIIKYNVFVPKNVISTGIQFIHSMEDCCGMKKKRF